MKKPFLPLIALAVALFVSCGDEENIVNQKFGADSVASYADLETCAGKTMGSLVYAEDSGKVYLCTDNGWKPVESGKKGADGKSAYELSGTDMTLEEWLESLKGGDGKSCTAKDVAGGVEVACGGDTTRLLKNGDDGESCRLLDNGDGTLTMVCGTADPVTLYKAMCGDAPYDPADKFCVLGKLYDKCMGRTYVVNAEYCHDGEVVPLCSEYKRRKDGTITGEFVVDRAPADGEFCWNGIVTPKCGGKEYGMNEYCGKAYDGKTDSIYTYCRNIADLDTIYRRIGLTVFPPDGGEEEGNDNPASSGLFGNLVGKPLAHYDADSLMRFFNDLERIKDGSTDCGIEQLAKCGSKIYNPDVQFCDIRDGHIYKYETIDGKQWMTENLAFEYKLPKVITAMDSTGGVIVRSLDQVAGKVNYETTAFENFEVNGARYYTWNSAVGVGDIRKDLADAGALAALNLAEEDSRAGACPLGWRLPTDAEFEALGALAVAADKGFAEFGFNLNFVGYYDVKDNNVSETSNAYFWSGVQVAADDQQAYGLVITAMDKSQVSTSNKAYAFTIRCVKE